jgi:hypothetical protein
MKSIRDKITNHALVSAINSLLRVVIAGYNTATFPEKESVYAKLYYPATRIN